MRSGNAATTVTTGCLSRSVRDTARWFDVTNGHDPADPLRAVLLENELYLRAGSMGPDIWYLSEAHKHYSELALRLVEQVHRVLGRFRPDDSRTGWLSGLDEEEGEEEEHEEGAEDEEEGEHGEDDEHDLNAVAAIQLGSDLLHVSPHRPQRDPQFAGHALVAMALEQQHDDLP